MNRQTIIIAIVAAAILLLAGVGAVVYGISQGGQIPGFGQEPTPNPTTAFEIPDIKVTPPASLSTIAEEIRADYPELADLLENPELGSVYKDFYLAYQKGGQETALALARQRGLLNEQDQVLMTLVLDTEDSAPLIAELEAEGVIVQGSYKDKINILIPITLIEEQIKAEEPDLILERISNLDHVIRLEVPNKATIKQRGLIQGQGVNVTEANEWQAAGLTGQGVKVGILDLGFGGYEDLLGEELPENVTAQAFGDPFNFDEEVHGTACAEIVHEMAPDAELYLAYYDGSDVAMGQAVDWLISQEVDIISNSTGSNGLTPMDGTGFAADLVNQAYDAGIFWVNAAGNEADVHWRGQFTDSNGDTIHEFMPDTDVLPFIPFGPGVETQIILSWDDWQAVDQDYELALLDKDGNLLSKSEEAQDGQPGQLPAEGFLYEFEDTEIYLLAIQNYDNQARGDATFDLFIQGGAMHPDFVVAERSLSSPSDARGAFAVGAVNWADDVLEPYSSQGPTSDGRIKPDLSAPSVVDSASYAPEAFDGTSAATPHVAGAAALVLQAFPDYSPKDIAAFLQERSIDLGDAGPYDTFGAGRLDLGETPAGAEPVETPVSTEAEPTPGSTEETPVEVAELQPTSTPRPPLEVGLPGQTGQPPQASTEAEEESSALSLIVGVGLCLICVGGLLFLAILVVGIVFMRRKK
ncbi:MAG: S8 family serine peptidase [Chloroflexi bacterium]|nr:S8 family serine peptidase [Chloroflexota bacterium]